MLRILGILDALTALVIVLFALQLVPWNALLACIIFLAGKAILFRDIASVLDGIVAVVLVFLLLGVQNTIILGLCIVYLVQKATRSIT